LLKNLKKKRKEIEIVEERIYTIPLRKVWATPRGKRTPRASRMLRDFVRRHMKTEDVEISNEVNEELWARSIEKPPRKIKVRLAKDKEGRVIVYSATAA
jgi:large subunit ribosomal protein L31e